MLTACASSGAKTPPTPPISEPDPIIEVRYETRQICPPELRRAPPARPVIPDDAIVHANPAGAAWLVEDAVWSGSLLTLFTDAQSACAEVRP